MPQDPNILVDLTAAKSDFEAHVIAQALTAHGVPAHAFSGAARAAHAEVAASLPFRVQVRRGDLERARDLLEEIRREHAELNWDEIDVGEPEDDGVLDPPDPAEIQRRQRAQTQSGDQPHRAGVAIPGRTGSPQRADPMMLLLIVLGLALVAGILIWILTGPPRP